MIRSLSRVDMRAGVFKYTYATYLRNKVEKLHIFMADAACIFILGQCIALRIKNGQFDEGCILFIILKQW